MCIEIDSLIVKTDIFNGFKYKYIFKKILYTFIFFGYNLIITIVISIAFERKDKMVRTIKLTPDRVQNFVDVTSKCDFDIDIYYNSYVVDAKSFLGVYGLDFTRPLSVSFDGYNTELEELLKEYSIAC